MTAYSNVADPTALAPVPSLAGKSANAADGTSALPSLALNVHVAENAFEPLAASK